jgi:4-aminobutyrate aminotransferase/(S)-3-amino-2-methylpropionate transaminase
VVQAVENAIKIARHATGRGATIAFEDAFHAALCADLTSKTKPYKFGFAPMPRGVRMPYAYCYRCAFGLSTLLRNPLCPAAGFFAPYLCRTNRC